MKVGIIGKGVVGTAVYEGLKHIGRDVSFYDPKFEGSKLEDVLDTDCIFVSVPTNQLPNGDCDTSIVESVVKELAVNQYAGLVAIKSTVVPGTAARLAKEYYPLRVCSVPEFLRAKSALADFMYHHDLLVIGTTDIWQADLIEKIHGHLPKNVVRVSPTEAEIIKYFNNVNHSVQIIFANIFYDICKKLGADYNAVYEAIIQRECFNPAYLMCNENLRGFGGHCLPKDTSAIGNLIKNLDLGYDTINAVLKDNEKLQ
jgi:UDPglucose 6-dehydrogenase